MRSVVARRFNTEVALVAYHCEVPYMNALQNDTPSLQSFLPRPLPELPARGETDKTRTDHSCFAPTAPPRRRQASIGFPYGRWTERTVRTTVLAAIIELDERDRSEGAPFAAASACPAARIETTTLVPSLDGVSTLRRKQHRRKMQW